MKCELDAQTVRPYLEQRGWLAPSEVAEIRELPGGVSNCVLRIDTAERSFVLKQARPQLRVAEPWFCSVERIYRETETLRWCGRLLDRVVDSQSVSPETGQLRVAVPICVPELLFEDREHYCFAMEAAPANHVTWKQQLLAGDLQPRIADLCGRLLGTLHGAGWQHGELHDALRDRTFFDELRLDPYYRHMARQNPARATRLTELIDSVARNLCSLVHGDFSPKNLLVFDGRVMLVDFEVGHFGDPAFDLGFFQTHLVLKTIHATPAHRHEYAALLTRFREAYAERLANFIDERTIARLEARGVHHLAGCLLARVDGKSPVEYLTADEQQVAMRAGEGLLVRAPCDWSEAAAILSDVVKVDF